MKRELSKSHEARTRCCCACCGARSEHQTGTCIVIMQYGDKEGTCTVHQAEHPPQGNCKSVIEAQIMANTVHKESVASHKGGKSPRLLRQTGVWPALMESDWYDLLGRLIEIMPADVRRRMGDIVRKANTGVRRNGVRTTVLIKIAFGKEEGSGYPDLPVSCGQDTHTHLCSTVCSKVRNAQLTRLAQGPAQLKNCIVVFVRPKRV